MLSLILESEEVQDEVHPTKHLQCSRSMGEYSSAQRDVNHVVLVCSSLSTESELHSSISNKDYSYFHDSLTSLTKVDWPN